MEERLSDTELEKILSENHSMEDKKELISSLANDLKEERARRRELEKSLLEVEAMLKTLKALEESKATLKAIKEDISFSEEEKTHYTTHDKILACSIWLLLRAKHKKKSSESTPGFSELRENLLEMQIDGHWPAKPVPSSSTLKGWYKKYKWEKIFSDYFFTFLMNKGFGVEIDYNEVVPELYKKWESEIETIDDVES